MKKLFSTDQIREWDRVTIARGLSSLALMERAALRLTEAICDRISFEASIAVIAGIGNNGGDALAVARLLKGNGYASVTPYLIKPDGQSPSSDCIANLRALDGTIQVQEIGGFPSLEELDGFDLLIDGLFGSGLSRPLTGFWAEIVQQMNESRTPVISIDIPSGAFADRIEGGLDIVQADLVLTLQIPKRVFMIPESQVFMKEFEVLDIGLDQNFHVEEECNLLYLESEDVSEPIRSKFSHKGSYGHTLLVAGSRGMYGAAILGAKACLRSGVGLLTIHSGAEALFIIQMAVPEAMFSDDKALDRVSALPELSRISAIACGPGLGVYGITQELIDDLLEVDLPMVLDADALNIIAEKGWQDRIPSGSIITPHPKEFERLFGRSGHSMDAIDLQSSMAQRYGIIIVRKGAHSTIALPDGRVIFNSSGNPYMAAGGMGDVLTGLIGGLLAQGLSAEQAAIIGVYEHGAAGDAALLSNGGGTLTCHDLIEELFRTN